MTVSDIHGQATEAGDPARFQVRLNSQPAADVTIVISSGDITEGTVSPPSLTFTTTDWNTARSVRIDGVDDLIADGPQTYDITLDPSSEDADGNALDTDYNTLASNIVSVITTDDERTGIVVSPTSGQATEGGGTSSFAVALETPPSANVNVVISSGDITEGTVSPPSLTFTTTDWNVLQAVTVTGVDDTDIDGPQTYDINLIASSSDAYNSVMSAVSVTTTDNETAGITLSATQLSLDEGATTMLAVRLDRAPTNDVTVTVLSEDTTGGTVFPANLTFTTTNWAIPQTVTVTGVDDFIDDGDQTYAISLTGVSSDLDYNTLAATAYATTLDDDTASMAVSPTALIFAENGSGTLTVQLGTQPTGDVTVSVKSGDVGEGTVSPTSLTFTSSDWNVPQMVSVNGVDNNDADGTRTYHVSLTPETSTVVEYYSLEAQQVFVTMTDDETPGITPGSVTGQATEEGGQASFAVVLDSPPFGTVQIGVSSGDLGEGTVSPTPLTFTTTNWNVPQTVTVTGVNDNIEDGPQTYDITLATQDHPGAAPEYIDLSQTVSVSTTDDDTADVTVSSVTGVATEAAGTATFMVALATEPIGTVQIGVSSGDLGEGTVSPTPLTFTTTNWNVPQTVTVTGVDDSIVDGAQTYDITLATQDHPGAAPEYIDLSRTVSVSTTDDDMVGLTLGSVSGQAAEDGGQATFTIVLNKEPIGTVQIGVSSGDLGEGTVSPTPLTFTTTNWNVPQTVTVTGVNDNIEDGAQTYDITLATQDHPGAAPEYIDLSRIVSVSTTDDDMVGFALSKTTLEFVEDSSGTFTVLLGTQPTADLTVDVSSNIPSSEGTISPTSLTFTTTNWSVPQTITVTGVDDSIEDGNQTYNVALTPGNTALEYSSLGGQTIPITITDNDAPATLSLAQADGSVGENAVYTSLAPTLTGTPIGGVSYSLGGAVYGGYDFRRCEHGCAGL